MPASAIAQAATPQTSAAPDAASGSFEQHVSQMRADIRAAQDGRIPNEMRRLGVDLAKLTDEVYHMGIEPQRLEDLGWKISIISRKTESALGRMQKLSQSLAKDPSLDAPAAGLVQNAQDLLGEFRRLEILTPRIQERIGYANEDARQFADEVRDAKQTASKLADEAQSLLSLVK